MVFTKKLVFIRVGGSFYCAIKNLTFENLSLCQRNFMKPIITDFISISNTN